MSFYDIVFQNAIEWNYEKIYKHYCREACEMAASEWINNSTLVVLLQLLGN